MSSVLIVEDDPVLQEVLWLNLRLAGHTVTTASDGAVALEAIAEHQPDAVVLDMMMPRVDGMTVLRTLKADPRTRRIPVVVVSAKATDADVWDGFQAGADHYLPKPVRVSALVDLVTGLVADARPAPMAAQATSGMLAR